MPLHNLSKEEQTKYLNSTVTSMQILMQADAYDSIEQAYESFNQVWGGLQHDAEGDALALKITAFYYYSKLQDALNLPLEQRLSALSRNKSMALDNEFFNRYDEENTKAVDSPLTTPSATPAEIRMWLITQYDNQISDLTCGNLLRKLHQEVDEFEQLHKEMSTDGTKQLLIIMKKLPISFDVSTDVPFLVRVHPLFQPLVEKLARGYLQSLTYEVETVKTLASMISAFRKMACMRDVLKTYCPTVSLINKDVESFAELLKNEINKESEYFSQFNFSEVRSIEEAKLVGFKLNQYVMTLFLEGLFTDIEEKKLVVSRYLHYVFNFFDTPIASNKEMIELFKRNLKFISHIRRSQEFVQFYEEEKRYEVNLELIEIMAQKQRVKDLEAQINGQNKSDLDVLDKLITAAKIKIKTYLDQSVEQKNDLEVIKTHILLHYYLSYYYSSLMMIYTRHSEVETLRSKAIPCYEKAVALTMEHFSGNDLKPFEQNKFIKKIEVQYAKNIKCSMPHIIKSILLQISRADKCFYDKDLSSAAQANEDCWKLIEQHPEIIVNNNIINSTLILWNTARLYRDIGVLDKAREYFNKIIIILKTNGMTLPELFEVRDFFSSYLITLKKKTSTTYFEIQNMQAILSDCIQKNVAGLTQIITQGPFEIQKQALGDLIEHFKKKASAYASFCDEIVSAYEVALAEAKRKNVKVRFPCYHQVLFDISCNIALNKVQLSVMTDKNRIQQDFFHLAVKAGNPQACYEFAKSQFDKKDYFKVCKKLALTLADEEWCNDPKNSTKKSNAEVMMNASNTQLNALHLSNPLKFFKGEKEALEQSLSPKSRGIINKVENHLKNPDCPPTPQSPNSPRLLMPLVNQMAQEDESKSQRLFRIGSDDELSLNRTVDDEEFIGAGCIVNPINTSMKGTEIKSLGQGILKNGNANSSTTKRKSVVFDSAQPSIKRFAYTSTEDMPEAVYMSTESFKVHERSNSLVLKQKKSTGKEKNSEGVRP